MLVARENASLLAVVVSLFYAIFAGYGINLRNAGSWGIRWLFDQSFNRWTAEALFSENVTPFKHLYLTDLTAQAWGYTLDRVSFDWGMGILSGICWRIIAYVLLIALHRDKQR
jgi:hypothetical protein